MGDLKASDLIGSAGVFLLLVAFFLNLFGWLDHRSRLYQLCNFLGAALSCYASVIIHYAPFVMLEAIWSLVALAALVRNHTTSPAVD